MAENDHLGNEVSLEVSVTENGGKATLKSRFAAAADRLGGNLVDALNISLESANVRKRAKSDGERDLIEAVAKHGVQLLGQDPELAKRALETHFGHVVRTQENKDAVLAEALEHLSASNENPGGEEQGVPPGDLAPEFLDRFERYAAEASTEELRSRWGRVLAREVQTPGTMSNKAMRIVDELDPRTAQLFERVCGEARVDNVLIESLLTDLKHSEILSLTDAGLINYSGGGTSRPYQRRDGPSPLLYLWFGDWVVSFSAETEIPKARIGGSGSRPIEQFQDKATTTVIMLTDAGQAVASILADNSEQTMRRFVEALHTSLPEASLGLYRRDETGMTRSHGIFVGGAWTA
jgi:Protein of unknown function (DUF2806)